MSSVAIGALAAAAPGAFAQDKLTILGSVPGLNFPFFVHMLNQIKAEAEKLGGINADRERRPEPAPKQTADIEAAITQGVNGIVISPLDVNAMAPALQAGGRGRHPGRHHRPPRRRRAEASSPMSAPTTSRAARRRAS